MDNKDGTVRRLLTVAARPRLRFVSRIAGCGVMEAGITSPHIPFPS